MGIINLREMRFYLLALAATTTFAISLKEETQLDAPELVEDDLDDDADEGEELPEVAEGEDYSNWPMLCKTTKTTWKGVQGILPLSKVLSQMAKYTGTTAAAIKSHCDL